MKKHLSVLMLFVRSTFYKVLGILILMCSAEFLIFSRAVTKAREDGNPGLEYAIEKSWLIFVFLAAWLAMILVLIPGLGNKKAKTAYTMNRLQITENWIFFWQAVYNTLCFALAVMVQIILAFGLCRYYVEFSGDETVTHQTIFLAFYRSEFLHSLVPFDEKYSMAANIITILILGLSSALNSLIEKYHKSGLPSFIGAYTVTCFLRRGTGDFLNNLCIFAIAAVVIIYTAYFLLTKEVRHDN